MILIDLSINPNLNHISQAMGSYIIHLINELEMPTTFESMIQVKNPTIQFEYRIPNQNRIFV